MQRGSRSNKVITRLLDSCHELMQTSGWSYNSTLRGRQNPRVAVFDQKPFLPVASTHSQSILIHTFLHKSSTFTTQAVEVALWGSSHNFRKCCNFSPGISIARSKEFKGFWVPAWGLCVCRRFRSMTPATKSYTFHSPVWQCSSPCSFLDVSCLTHVLATSQAGTPAEDLVLCSLTTAVLIWNQVSIDNMGIFTVKGNMLDVSTLTLIRSIIPTGFSWTLVFLWLWMFYSQKCHS